MSNPEDRRPRVLVCDPIHEAGLDILRQQCDTNIRTNLTPSQLLDIIGQYDALVVRRNTQVTAEVLERGQKLKIVGRVGTGLQNIAVSHAKELNIQVVNSPAANTLAVAEHTMGLMLAIARRLPHAYQSLQSGSWDKNALMGTGLAGKTLGIIGFGHIGREVATRAQAFGMKIIINQKRPTPELNWADENNTAVDIENVDLYDLLQRADFISLHVPSRPETSGLIGEKELQLMQPHAYLINTARGQVIDQAALLNALNQNRLAGAALDVFSEAQTDGQEEKTTAELIHHPLVIATPHIGARTAEAQRTAAIMIAEQINDLFAQIDMKPILPLRVVPMDKIFPHESIDPKRVQRLADRLANEGILRNPAIVTEVENGQYMVLDGATRTAAFKKLGYPHTVVQISNPEDGLGLHTWYHAIQDIPTNQLLQIIEDIPNITLTPTTAEKANDDMFAYASLCYLHTTDDRAFLVQTAPGYNRLDALNQLTETYIAAGTVERTLEKNLTTVRQEFPNLALLVVFPEYTVSQVMQVTLSGRYFPAGITRFIIPGRILRLNADISVLKNRNQSLSDKNKWLHETLAQKVNQNAIRYYAEPLYLLDE